MKKSSLTNQGCKLQFGRIRQRQARCPLLLIPNIWSNANVSLKQYLKPKSLKDANVEILSRNHLIVTTSPTTEYIKKFCKKTHESRETKSLKN